MKSLHTARQVKSKSQRSQTGLTRSYLHPRHAVEFEGFEDVRFKKSLNNVRKTYKLILRCLYTSLKAPRSQIVLKRRYLHPFVGWNLAAVAWTLSVHDLDCTSRVEKTSIQINLRSWSFWRLQLLQQNGFDVKLRRQLKNQKPEQCWLVRTLAGTFSCIHTQTQADSKSFTATWMYTND